MIVLPRTLFEKLHAYCLDTLPNEACGLVGGIVSGQERLVKEIYFIRNLDESPEHFSMDPQEQFAAYKSMKKNGWTMLGNFHSHPSTPSRPSAEDIRLAFDPEVSYLILSLQDDQGVLKSFRISEGEVREEELIIQ